MKMLDLGTLKSDRNIIQWFWKLFFFTVREESDLWLSYTFHLEVSEDTSSQEHAKWDG